MEPRTIQHPRHPRQRCRSRRLQNAVGRLTLAALVTLVGLASLALPGGAAEVATDAETAVREIVFPVVGTSTYSDSFGACRSGCTRGHEGTDVMAAKLARLVAARDSQVRSLKGTATPDGSQGNYLILRDAEGWEYWYVHINNDSPGTDDGANPPEWIFGPDISEGASVVAGQLVGFVGDSGNAEATAPHLHFEIHKPDGTVINPYRSLQQAVHIEDPVDPDDARRSSPDGRFVSALVHDFLFRSATEVDVLTRLEQLDALGRDRLVASFAGSDEWVAALVDRYYRSTLGRTADEAGRRHWIQVIRSGRTPAEVASFFYASAEYHRLAGGTDRAWITDLYEELLLRTPDTAGLEFWTHRLAAGADRSLVASDFYASLESRRTRVSSLYDSLLGRTPDHAGHAYWSEVLQDGQDIRLATFLASSAEYYERAAGGDRTL